MLDDASKATADTIRMLQQQIRNAERRLEMKQDDCAELASAVIRAERERDEALQRNDELREELADERAARREAEEAVTELQLMLHRLTTPLRTGTEG